MGSFSIALSGLDADSTALNTIGNNLANLNTTAYKGETTSFETLFSQELGQSGSGDPIQIGAGTKVSGTTTDFSGGTLLPDSDTNNSDMALDGDGFFVVEQNGQQSLTRAGNFQVANNGALTTQDGQSVLGYPATGGVVSTNTSPQPITLPVGTTEGAQATQNISVTVNLNSNATGGDQFTTPVQIFDSLGQAHQATMELFGVAAFRRCNRNAGEQYWNANIRFEWEFDITDRDCKRDKLSWPRGRSEQPYVQLEFKW